MTINIRSTGIEVTETLREHIERTLAFALDRFAPRIENVSVFLADLNGPRGGVSTLCQITARLASGRPINILQHHSEIEAGIKYATERMKTAISRTLNRVKRQVRVLSKSSVRAQAVALAN